jgi:hypothetical protein
MSTANVGSHKPSADQEAVVSILKLMATRMHWQHAKTLVSGTGLHASRGWLDTIVRAREDHHNESTWVAARKTLGAVAAQHTYVGNKRVTFFDLREQNEDVRKRFVNWAVGSAISDLKPVLHRRPFELLEAPTDQAMLEELKAKQPALIAANTIGGKVFLQFFSTRSYATREHVDLSSLSKSQRAAFEEYDEVIGVRTRWVPCFDTVTIDPANDLAEFRIDYAPGLGLVGERENVAFSRLHSAFERVSNKFVGDHAIAASMMNLFPAINPLYIDKRCGRVTALGFIATSSDSSSNNYGKIHRTKTQDFRKDRFHVGGSESVDKVEPYAIGVTWPAKPPKTDLYLEVKSNVRTMYSGKVRAVSVAEIEGCQDMADYDFVADQVLSRIKRRKP